MRIPPPGIHKDVYSASFAEPGLTIGLEYRDRDSLQLSGEPETENFHVRYRSATTRFGTGSRQG